MYLKRLPLFITATCDFGRYDHEETSGGEILCLNPNGGGIALITTTRVVYISDNHYLNSGVAQQIFKKMKITSIHDSATYCVKRNATLHKQIATN